MRRPYAEVSVLLTEDGHIRDLNHDWRGVDRPTDVLSWAQEQEPAAQEHEDLLGDVVISLPTAARQAAARGWALEDEVALLLVHGILHLLGHEDDTLAGARKMRRAERRILGKPLVRIRASAAGAVS